MLIGEVTRALHTTDSSKISNKTKDKVCLLNTLIKIIRINQTTTFSADLNNLMGCHLEILVHLFTRMEHLKKPIWGQENYLIPVYK
jgi:hypothetical protein